MHRWTDTTQYLILWAPQIYDNELAMRKLMTIINDAQPVVERWIRRELGPQAQARDALNEVIAAARALSRLIQDPPAPTAMVIEKPRTPAWVAASLTVAVVAALTALGLSLWPYLH